MNLYHRNCMLIKNGVLFQEINFFNYVYKNKEKGKPKNKANK